MRITDNGRGFAGMNGFGTPEESGGNGLINIRKRANELKGNINIQSETGKGTIVELVFKI
jgi:signal transduction histidine kinase